MDTRGALVNPCVFVVGCPRSGTTLAQRMLDAHPDLCVANDTHFITRAAKRELRRDDDPPLTAELVEQVISYHRFHRMGLDRDEVLAAAEDAVRYSEFVSRLYDRRAARAGKTLSGEKTPDYCRQMPVLHRLFPDARFVHVIRDGRDTALSALDWAHSGKGPGRWDLWREDPLGACALWWRWQAGGGLRDGAGLPASHYLELRYEAVVADPEAEMRAVCDFLRMPYSPRMARFHEGKTKAAPGLSAKSAWLGPTPGLRDWRRDMGTEDAAVFEAIAGGVLDTAGYDRKNYPQSQSVSNRAERCLAWWSQAGKR